MRKLFFICFFIAGSIFINAKSLKIVRSESGEVTQPEEVINLYSVSVRNVSEWLLKESDGRYYFENDNGDRKFLYSGGIVGVDKAIEHDDEVGFPVSLEDLKVGDRYYRVVLVRDKPVQDAALPNEVIYWSKSKK